MTQEDITGIRLANQQISYRKFDSVKDLIGYMGAFQSQDYTMAKWAVGLRLKEGDESTINEALERGEILRTHLLRPTWHFVSPDNLRWMLELTASRIKSSMSSRNKQLELTKEIFKKSNKIISEALAVNNHLTREELIKLLNKEKIKTDQNRASHLLAEAELTGLICSGVPKGNKITYALLEERVKTYNTLTKDQSLVKLAGTYFMSRGPASLEDFAWWSGLNLTLARKALEMIYSEINSFKINSKTYWFMKSSFKFPVQSDKLFLLPTYDEFIISYKNRSAILSSDLHRGIISTNGIFRAPVVYNGKVIGIWKRNIIKNNVNLEINCFKHPGKKINQLIEYEAERYSRFLGKDYFEIKY
jgi:hypothetical protein